MARLRLRIAGQFRRASDAQGIPRFRPAGQCARSRHRHHHRRRLHARSSRRWSTTSSCRRSGSSLGGVDFSQLFVVLKGDGDYNTVAQAKDAGAVTWNIGLFINAVIKFLIVAFAVFLLVKAHQQARAQAAAGAAAAGRAAGGRRAAARDPRPARGPPDLRTRRSAAPIALIRKFGGTPRRCPG